MARGGEIFAVWDEGLFEVEVGIAEEEEEELLRLDCWAG